MENNYCVIGNPVAHSLSPVIHKELYKIYNITNCFYDKIQPLVLAEFINSIHVNNIHGFNVTMPYKEDIIPFLHEKQNDFSINTVVVKNKKLYGYSTDAQGFSKGLASIGGNIEGEKIVIIGAGAVAKLFVHEFSTAKEIVIYNRTHKKAQDLCIRKNVFSSTSLEDQMAHCGLLINTTPLGMTGNPDFSSFDFLDYLPKNAIVYDLLYNPPETNLLSQSKKRGLSTQNGLDMLIWQGFFAFEKFFDIMPSYKDFVHIKSILSKYN